MILFLNILVLSCFLYAISLLYKKNRVFFYSSLICILSNFYGICSSLYIDVTKVYLFEIDSYSKPNGSIIINFIAFFFYLIIGILAGGTRRVINHRTRKSHILFILIICEAILYTNYFISDKPYFTEVTRMNYWSNSRFFFVRYILGETSSFIFFGSGLVFFLKKNRAGIYLLLSHLLYNILIGQKFGSIYEGFIYFFMPYLISQLPSISFKHVVSFFLFFSVAIGTIYLSFSYFNPYGHLEEGDTIFKAIMYRAFALQSQLPWITMEVLSLNDIALLKNDYFWNGMNSFLKDYSVTDMSDYDPSKMARLTNAYPSNFLMWNPLLGLIMVFFSSCILYFSQHKFVKSFFTGNFLQTIFYFQLFLSILNSIMMAETKKFFLFSVVLIISHMILLTKNRNIASSY